MWRRKPCDCFYAVVHACMLRYTYIFERKKYQEIDQAEDTAYLVWTLAGWFLNNHFPADVAIVILPLSLQWRRQLHKMTVLTQGHCWRNGWHWSWRRNVPQTTWPSATFSGRPWPCSRRSVNPSHETLCHSSWPFWSMFCFVFLLLSPFLIFCFACCWNHWFTWNYWVDIIFDLFLLVTHLNGLSTSLDDIFDIILLFFFYGTSSR